MPSYDTGMLCKEKSAERRKEVEENGGRRGGIRSQTTRNATRVKEEFGGRVEKESRGAFVIIDLIDSRCSTHRLLLCFISLHISNSSVSTSLVGYVLYLVDLISTICIPYFYLMVHGYIYSRYSSVFLMLYQLYHSLPFSTLISFSSLYLKLQPES